MFRGLNNKAIYYRSDITNSIKKDYKNQNTANKKYYIKRNKA